MSDTTHLSGEQTIYSAHKKVSFMNKDILTLLGIFAIAIGGVTMLANSADFTNFPLRLTPVPAFGIVLVMLGIVGVYYGTR